jgi:hypothetical protein
VEVRAALVVLVVEVEPPQPATNAATASPAAVIRRRRQEPTQAHWNAITTAAVMRLLISRLLSSALTPAD